MSLTPPTNPTWITKTGHFLNSQRTLLVLCLFATWVIWGSTYVAIKFALVSFPPFYQMGTRFVVAGAVMLLWLLWRSVPWPSRQQWLHATWVGALMMGGGYGFTALAETSVGSGLVVTFIAVVPLLIAAMNLFWGQRPSRYEWVGMAVGMAGVIMLASGQGFAASTEGLLAIVFACLTWSLGNVLCKHWWPLAPGPMGYATQMLSGGVILMLMGALNGESIQWPLADIALWSWVYLVIAGSLIAFNAYMYLLDHAPMALASSYTFVNPVIGLGLGVLLADEWVTPFEWGAAAVISLGVVLLFLGTKPTNKG